MDLTSIIIAASIPSAITGFCFWLLERKIKQKDDQDKVERERPRERKESKHMARNVIIVNATQVVTSESNPMGIFSIVTGFPKVFDSGEGGDIEQTMKTAKSAYFAQLSANYANTNPARVMTTVTLEMANGQQILRECIGAFPDMTPVPETEIPEEEVPTEEQL